MPEFNESDLNAFYEDIEILIDTLRKVFNAEKSRYYYDEKNEQLFIEIEGLETMDEEEVEEAATEVFDELDLDFDAITLLPYRE